MFEYNAGKIEAEEGQEARGTGCITAFSKEAGLTKTTPCGTVELQEDGRTTRPPFHCPVPLYSIKITLKH